jgi:hypothetical protein
VATQRLTAPCSRDAAAATAQSPLRTPSWTAY